MNYQGIIHQFPLKYHYFHAAKLRTISCTRKFVSKLPAFLETVSNVSYFLETDRRTMPTKARNVSRHHPAQSADKAPLIDYSQANLSPQSVIFVICYFVIFLFLSRACTLLYILYIRYILYII